MWIFGCYFRIIAYIDYMSVLYYYEAIIEIVVAFLFVIKERIGLECQNLAA